MSPSVPTYTIVSRVHVSQWVNDLQETVPGWLIKARWNATRSILPVFVPDDVYTPETVDSAIRAAGAVDSQIHALGQ